MAKSCVRLVCVIMATVFLFGSCAIAEELQPFPAPGFSLQDMDKNTVELSSYIDKKQPVLLFFWTTWCPFCQKELRTLSKRYGGLVKDGLEVLAIDVGEHLAKVYSFAKAHYLAYRVLIDLDASVARAYDILGVPTYVLINKKGKVVFKDNFFPQQYKDLISK